MTHDEFLLRHQSKKYFKSLLFFFVIIVTGFFNWFIVGF